DPRHRPHRGRARGDADVRRLARRPRGRHGGLVGHGGVGLRGLRPRRPPRAGGRGHHGAAPPAPGRRADAHDGRLRGVLPPRPRGALLHRPV
ncbi:MAG: hypothetical protein AVDCRST_MAG13-1735, partial [uncultured Solirubrobacteraceae bacterium]